MNRSPFVPTKLDNCLIINNLITIHFLQIHPNYVFKGERHNFWELVYVDSGSCIEMVENEEKLVKCGDIIFHKPNEFHAIRGNGHSTSSAFIVTFKCTNKILKNFDRLHTKLPVRLKYLISQIIDMAREAFILPKFDPNLVQLVKNPLAPIGSTQLIKNSLEHLLIMLIREITADTINPKSTTLPQTLAMAVVDLLRQNLYSDLSIEQLCQKLYYGKTHLCNTFASIMNTSIMKYYTTLKINESKILLRQGDYSIRQIAELLHFSSPQHFNKVFATANKMSPSQYKFQLLPIEDLLD